MAISERIGVEQPLELEADTQAQPGVAWRNVLRLGLFQFGMGVSLAPITGTLNRVLIDDLRIPAVAVSFLIALHYFVSPYRAVFGFRSDKKRALGRWRTPDLVLGAMLTYGGLACAPFALILLGGNGSGRISFGPAMVVCTLVFLAYGIGVNMVETIYLAIVSDITPPRERGKVLAVLWMMLVLGTVVGSVAIGQMLQHYTHVLLIQVMQTSAVLFIFLTAVALWKQERLRPDGSVDTPDPDTVRATLGESLRVLAGQRRLLLLFATLFIATAGFATHDVLLEPYGGQVLGMSVSATTQLTALWGIAMLVAIGVAGLLLWRRVSPAWLLGGGCAAGALGFLVISYASNGALVTPFRGGVALIGLGRGLFIVGSLTLLMSLADKAHTGLFMGLWGVMQALAQGLGTIGGGLTRDLAQATTGSVVLGYTVVYMAALGLLVLALASLLVLRPARQISTGAMRSPWAALQDVPADQLIA